MLIAIRIILLLVGTVIISGTAVNFSKHPHWLIRIWDFPRMITAAVSLALAGTYAALFHGGWYDWVFVGALALVVARQVYMIAPYTPLRPTRVKQSARPPGPSSLRLLISNVKMENSDFGRWHAVVRDADPDVVVAVETGTPWDEALRPLGERYPHCLRQIQDNYYGMVIYSRLEMEEATVRFLVQDDIPSIHATLRLKDGQRVALHALHPRPPEPINNQDSAPRDAELVLMGKEINENQRRVPTVVCGDLNDVAWSFTTQLFLRMSKLLDPRMGRGLYNSFNADSRIFRFPLDHVFHSDEFKLLDLRRLPHVGSDHFPMLIELSCEPESAPRDQPEPIEHSDDREQAHEILNEQAERETTGEEKGHVAQSHGNPHSG